MRDETMFPLIGLIFIGLLICMVCVMRDARCESQWERSGLRSEWGFIQGCMVERKDGTWVPERMLRDIEQ